jgi:ubiquinone/menaquinone biosynthesis C-methylase UbiE
MWVGYLRLLFAHFEVRPEEILDVCCGTGSMAELLTKEHYSVTGFDISEPMIAEARRKAKEKELDIEYIVADAATFDIAQDFDAAYSFFDSLNYINDLHQFRKALVRVAAHLRPGALFVFDLNTAYAFEKQMFDQQNLRKGAKLRYKWVSDYDPATRQIAVNMTFWRDDEEFHEVHRQRAHSHDEVVQGLQDAGFEQIRVFDSYTLDPPRRTSDRVHYCARTSY